MSTLWIIECGASARASDVLRSTRGIRDAYGPGAVIRVDGLLPAEQLLLTGLPGVLPLELQETLSLSDVRRAPLATLLPAGAVPVAPAAAGQGPYASVQISAVGSYHQRDSVENERVARNRFEADLRLLSTQTVLSLPGSILAALWEAAEKGQPRSVLPVGQWLRTLIHASALPVEDAGQVWVSASDTADQGSFLERIRGISLRESIPSLITVVLANAGDDEVQPERALESVRASDLGLCPLVVLGSPGNGQTGAGNTLFTLLVHPDQQVHANTGQILLGLMAESSVALLRALVDDSPSPVELWWSRALLLGLQQEDIDIDRFARVYGDERWIAASWAGIWLDGTEPRRIPKRFMEQVK